MTIRTRKDTMDLKNLLEMQKADKYTQDGRDTIIKAQTEDKVYQLGEISQKTGLQKTAKGWVQPKNGAPKGAGIPKANNQTFVGKTYKDFAESARASGYKPSKDTENPDGSSTTIFKNQNGEQTRVEFGTDGKITETTKESAGTAPKENYESFLKSLSPDQREAVEEIENDMQQVTEKDIGHEAFDDLNTKYRMFMNSGDMGKLKEVAQILQQASGNAYKALERESTSPAPQRKAQSSSSLKGYLENNFWSQPEDFENDIKEAGWDVEEMNGEYAVVSNEAGSQYEVRFSPHGDGHDLTMESFTPLMIDEDDEDDDIDDSAPRTLTGDTRLRLSQVTDRVYKPGEISEKTGLQKQTDGSWAPPKNGSTTETKQEATPQNDYKVGETVTFKARGKYYKGKVTSVGKNLIQFETPEGESMGFSRESIEKVHIPNRNKNKSTESTQSDEFKDLKNKSGPEKRKIIHSAVKATNPKYAVKTWKNWKGEEQKQYCELKLKGKGEGEYYTDKETGNAFMMGKAEEAKINKNGNVEFSYTLQSTGTPMRVEFTQTKPEGVVKSEYKAPGPTGVPSSKQLLSHLV